MPSQIPDTITRADRSALTLRDLIDQNPAVLPVLTRFGLDTCCGSGRTLAEAATLHNIPLDALLADVEAALSEQGGAA
jgi:iron-sulfur cluster repair protein YtfE (RIC family)